MQPATSMGQNETPSHNGVYEGATDIALKKQHLGKISNTLLPLELRCEQALDVT